jgi:hypothetical protein
MSRGHAKPNRRNVDLGRYRDGRRPKAECRVGGMGIAGGRGNPVCTSVGISTERLPLRVLHPTYRESHMTLQSRSDTPSIWRPNPLKPPFMRSVHPSTAIAPCLRHWCQGSGTGGGVAAPYVPTLPGQLHPIWRAAVLSGRQPPRGRSRLHLIALQTKYSRKEEHQ